MSNASIRRDENKPASLHTRRLGLFSEASTMHQVTGYRLISYGDMITDRPRMDAYAQALQQAVSPGCVVVDIGAGTGIFSLLACQLGAGHVHAVEPDVSIEVARAMAAANGYSNRITFHEAVSTKVGLSAVADVIVSDLRGILPLLQHHIPSIIDARERLLAPDGLLIPKADTLWAAVVEVPDLYRPYREPWMSNEWGLDMRAGRRPVVNSWSKANAKPGQLLVAPQHWATVDYESIEGPDIAGELSWCAERPGTAHGVLVWFDADLGNGIGFSNAPGQEELIYGQAFFPLYEPVALVPGDEVLVELSANLVGGDYVWRWRTRVTGGTESRKPKAAFDQSTFFGDVLSPSQFRRREGRLYTSSQRRGSGGPLPALPYGRPEVLVRDRSPRSSPFPRLLFPLGRGARQSWRARRQIRPLTE